MTPHFRILLFALGCGLLLFAPQVQAQYELKASNFNGLYQGAVPSATNNLPITANSNFRGVGAVSGSSSVIDATPNDASAPGNIPAAQADKFPAGAGKTIVLMRSTIGGAFASGVPRYFFGDVISPPLVKADGLTPAPAGYWRAQPVSPGELITPFVTVGSVTVNNSALNSPTVTVVSVPSTLGVGSTLLGRGVSVINSNTITLNGNANQAIASATSVPYVSVPTTITPVALGSVNVTAASTGSTQVSVATVPAALVVGATLLGQPVTAISGTAITLAGNANQTITSSTAISITPALPYYYSPHAEKVYASQAGRVTVLWVSLVATENGGYETLLDTFAVSSNSNSPVRTIFWTEGSFDGPRVQIKDGRITTVNPVYYSVVPKAVAQEVSIPGYTPPTANLTTLSFDKFNGIGQIHAYNVEGRILIEYLGTIRLAGNIYESIDTEVVELVRVPTVRYPTVHLGTELKPHDGAVDLTPSPVLSSVQAAANYYGTTVRPDGTSAYYAERETSSANDPDNSNPSEPNEAYNKVVFYWLETGKYSIQWPKFQNRYWQRWSPSLADYAHYSVDAAGSTPATGIPFTGGALPQIVYQDDPAQNEAKIDINTQRLYVEFAPGSDQRNRSLLKFNSSGKSWYVNLYSQAEDRVTTRAVDVNGTSTVTLTGEATTVGLEVGMVITGTGITGTATIISITDSKHFVISQNVSTDTTFTFTVESDALAPIVANATVGSRLTPPAGHENAGYISGGTGYYPAGYLNPFTVGVANANRGAIIPVNALPTDNLLTVRWFKKIPAASAEFPDLYVPGKIGRYTVSYPASTSPQIVIAQGVGTGDLPVPEAAGSIYYQNAQGQPGYNPNEEHALMLGGRAYALREDLNVTSGGGYTSQPFVLVAYKDASDDRPAMHAYKVVRSNATYDFAYDATAGTLLVTPYPLPLLPEPLVELEGETYTRNREITIPEPINNGSVSILPVYRNFTFTDRKGFIWIHRGPHNGGNPALFMKLYYLSQPGFYIPATGEPAVGTALPFLRHTNRSGQPLNINAIDVGQADEPLTISYSPKWPANAPELRVGETLTLPKFGLPQVRGQASAQVLYQQSIANASPVTFQTRTSVTLHDPTREKTIPININAVGLSQLPPGIKTSSYQGRTYFQNLPPHLQQRFYFDPLRGTKGTLVLTGVFHDELAGEDYLDLNVLSARDKLALHDLLLPNNATGKANWTAAIELLFTRVETFKRNPAQAGSYIPDPSQTTSVQGDKLAVIDSSETAVDSYAITATGQGSGFVTMVFGNGRAFTPAGDPVQIQVFKIANQLYVGDLKVISSSNPLSEQVTLRHSADFAGKPEDYEFEWRWATGEASAPATYANVMTKRIGDPITSTHNWFILRDPGTLSQQAISSGDFSAAGPAVPLPRTENVRPVNYVLDAQNQPTSTVIDATSYTDAEMAAGCPSLLLMSNMDVNFTAGVPGKIVFSADLDDLDGFVLLVNGKFALAHNAPRAGASQTSSSSGLTDSGLTKQFDIAPSYFRKGTNSIIVAVYTAADPNSQSTLNFMLEAAEETDLVDAAVTPSTQWQTPQDPDGMNNNFAVVGGNPTNPFGGPQFVLNDRWFTMRYRAKQFRADGSFNPAYALTGNGQPSRWLPPQFVEGWIKRVLAAINPFEQRVKDLYNNQVNTDVSVLTQAGAKWEGDIALTLENINEVGLIAIYETVLNRAKSMSIDANTNDPDTNNALLLAAGYLNDLYTLIGNEAYADASNPTISLDDQTTVTEVNTSRFSFESQVASSLEEELALLRGRDDFVSPGVIMGPAYNRLYWNYTRGINSGEVLYAVNYNIKEKVGSSTANGVIDEADAQRMFPQGHGDAYGHYLTALTGYYQLLGHSNFTWTPRAEAVTVAGQAVTVDFHDERKFAAAAGNIARTAQQIVSLAYRQSYKDNPGAGWGSYRDSKGTNISTGVTSHQGLDEWASRSAQGAYLNWVAGNALVPDVDTYHTGVQKIDRTTIPELPQLASTAESFQNTLDNANAHLNPLGLSPGAVAFDISPSEMLAGQSHFDQVYGRALQSLVNAADAFNQAGKMSGSLRNQQNQIDDYNTVIVQQETSYVNQLIDIFGRPYSGEIGAGKLYAQDYDGPDLAHWFIVDRLTDMVDTTSPVLVGVVVPANIRYFTGDGITDILKDLIAPTTQSRTIGVYPNQFIQYSDRWAPGGLGSRPETGELQAALTDAHRALIDLRAMNHSQLVLLANFKRAATLFQESVANHTAQISDRDATRDAIIIIETVQKTLETAADLAEFTADFADNMGDTTQEFFPMMVGFATDVTSPLRGASRLTGDIAWSIATAIQLSTQAAARFMDVAVDGEQMAMETRLAALGFQEEERQQAYEFEKLYRELTSQHFQVAQLASNYQRANESVRNVIAKGSRILAEREVFRQRAAAIIQGHRTKDVTFRLFRNEALEQYRSLFDLASRYTYLAAKSYDYETGLLGSTTGQTVFKDIVAARSLGDVTDGAPLSTSSSIGDSGLAGTMARMSADFSVAKGRLGINNPDQYGTVFSLRTELYRLLNDDSVTSDDDAWRQTLEQHIVANVLTDGDVATHCRNIKKPNGTPVPGIIIPFTTSIQHSKNFFGLDLAAGDHAYTPSSYATKIYNVGIALPGYVGMDTYASGGMSAGAPASGAANALSATPYVYLIPCGNDYMLAPPLGDTNTLRSWTVSDQALPLPHNLGASSFNNTQFFNANGTLSEQPWIIRKHQAFRMVSDASAFYSSMPAEFTNSRLIGRSVWNGKWKLVIPAYTLLSDEQSGLDRFAASVKDIQLFLRTYSHSGN